MNNERTLTLSGVRLSYVNLFTPKKPANGQGREKYSTTILLPKTDVAAKQRLDAAIDAAITEGVPAKWGGVRPPQPAIPVHDGDGTRPSDGMPFGPECKGHWVFTAGSYPEYPPIVVGPDRQPIMDAAQIYSGIYADVNVTFYAYSNSGRKGIGCGLNGVMKTRDGEPLAAARPDVDRMFAPPAQAQTAYTQPVQPQGAYAQETYAQPYGAWQAPY